MKNLNYTTKTRLSKSCLIFLLCAVLAGCGTDKNKSLEIVKKTFPNSKVYKFSDSDYTFYIFDSTGMKKVTCFNLTDDEIDGVYGALEK